MFPMRFMLPGCLVVLLLGSLAAAPVADIAGKWTADTFMSASGDSTPVPTTFTFAVNGDTLSGNVSSSAGTFDIQDGKIDGNSLTFTIQVTGGAPFKMFYDGRLTDKGHDFIVKVEGRDRSDHFVATRSSR